MLEAEQEAKQKAVRTLMYPVAIMGLAFLTLGVLLVVAMPSLLKVFGQLGAEVPLMTRIALASMEWVTANLAKMVLIFPSSSEALSFFIVRPTAASCWTH